MVITWKNKIKTFYITFSFKDALAAVDAGVDSSLWHCRLEHMSEKRINEDTIIKWKITEAKVC